MIDMANRYHNDVHVRIILLYTLVRDIDKSSKSEQNLVRGPLAEGLVPMGEKWRSYKLPFAHCPPTRQTDGRI